MRWAIQLRRDKTDLAAALLGLPAVLESVCLLASTRNTSVKATSGNLLSHTCLHIPSHPEAPLSGIRAFLCFETSSGGKAKVLINGIWLPSILLAPDHPCQLHYPQTWEVTGPLHLFPHAAWMITPQTPG